jgi:large subunit GTPase 1
MIFIERQNIKIIDPNSSQINEKESKNANSGQELEPLLVPRRPKWDTNTTPEELDRLENESYLEWRRKLAQLQERDDIVLTPFEKNIEFWRQLWRVIERSDVCLQILDARNPLLFLCQDLQKYVKEVNEQKINVILLNKSDLLNERQRQIWAQYFDDIGIKAVFFSALQQSEGVKEEDINETLQNDNELKLSKLKINETNRSNLLSKQQLIDYFKSFINLKESKSITIGLVGYPNVGKSSTINALLQSKRVSVSATPGKTKHFQTIVVDDELTLCDCPGLVFPNVVSSKAEMIVNGILPIDHMKDPIPPISLITSKIPRYIFESQYSIVLPKPTEFEDENRSATAEELLTAYGYSRGFMTQRGIPDNSRSARYILKDFVNGKLLYCYSPPNFVQKQFHEFPEQKEDKKQSMTKPLKRIMESNHISQKDFNTSYFERQSSKVHSKGIHGITGYTRMSSDHIKHCGTETETNSTVGSSNGLNEKPWKKHNNRNKREKLRRVYAHLDQ